MDDRGFMPHIENAQTALASAQQNIIQVIANKRKDIANAMLLDRVDKQLRSGFHSVIIIAGEKSPELLREGSSGKSILPAQAQRELHGAR